MFFLLFLFVVGFALFRGVEGREGRRGRERREHGVKWCRYGLGDPQTKTKMDMVGDG